MKIEVRASLIEILELVEMCKFKDLQNLHILHFHDEFYAWSIKNLHQVYVMSYKHFFGIKIQEKKPESEKKCPCILGSKRMRMEKIDPWFMCCQEWEKGSKMFFWKIKLYTQHKMVMIGQQHACLMLGDEERGKKD